MVQSYSAQLQNAQLWLRCTEHPAYSIHCEVGQSNILAMINSLATMQRIGYDYDLRETVQLTWLSVYSRCVGSAANL